MNLGSEATINKSIGKKVQNKSCAMKEIEVFRNVGERLRPILKLSLNPMPFSKWTEL